MGPQSLPQNWNQWRELIESQGAECLNSELSAKNVEHSLSTARSRNPQKVLCHLVTPLLSSLSANVHGVNIITSLVNYGTVRTVNLLCSSLQKTVSSLVLSGGLDKDRALREAFGSLIERIMYRVDCTEDARKEVVNFVRRQEKTSLFSSAITLKGVARLMVVDPAFAADVAKNKEAKTSYRDALYATDIRNTAKEAYGILLSDGKREEHYSILCQFVYDCVATVFARKDAKYKPQAELALCIATNCPTEIVNKLAASVSGWDDLKECLATNLVYYNVLAVLLERCDQAMVANKLAASLFTSTTEVEKLLVGRKTAPLHLLATIGNSPALTAAVEKSTGASLAVQLRAAKSCFTKATVPKSVATRASLQEKLKALNSSKTPIGEKRQREEN